MSVVELEEQQTQTPAKSEIKHILSFDPARYLCGKKLPQPFTGRAIFDFPEEQCLVCLDMWQGLGMWRQLRLYLFWKK